MKFICKSLLFGMAMLMLTVGTSFGSLSLKSSLSQYAVCDTTPITDYPFTISYWAKVDNITANHLIAGLFRSTGGYSGGYSSLNGSAAGDYVEAVVCDNGETYPSWKVASTTSAYSAETWHQIVAIFTSSTSRSVYIDGGSVGTNTTSLTLDSIGEIVIGAYFDGSTSTYLGFPDANIAEVGFWSEALSAGDIVDLCTNKKSPLLVSNDTLQVYYPFGGPNYSNNVEDYKGAYDLTAYGTPTYTDHPPGIDYGSVTSSVPAIMHTIQHQNLN